MNLTDENKRETFVQAIVDGKNVLVKNLLIGGIDPNLNTKFNGWSALHFAVEHERIEIGEILLEHGATVDFPDNFGCTPLYFAVDLEADSASQLSTVAIPYFSKMLLEHGANPYYQNHEGETPLALAQIYRYESFIQIVK